MHEPAFSSESILSNMLERPSRMAGRPFSSQLLMLPDVRKKEKNRGIKKEQEAIAYSLIPT